HVEMVLKGNKHRAEGVAGIALEKLVCTDCHLGVVHPHMPGDLFKAYAAKKIKPYGTYGETDCLACHKMATPDVVKEWTKGAHAAKGITCINCHGNDHRAIAKKHGYVSPGTCGECHQTQLADFRQSSHNQGHAVAKVSHYDVVSTKQLTMKDCKGCHKMALAYENDRVGGSCNACHPSHKFSVAEAKASDACEKCHVGGPDHSQLDTSSGSIFSKVTELRKQGLISKDLITCQTCHGPQKSHNFNKTFTPESVDVLLFGGHGYFKAQAKH
ncbi:MAG: multiheme c-type cytochrome, partial [Planctomycetota bacterium]